MWSNFSFTVLNTFWLLSCLRHWKKYLCCTEKNYEICNSHYLMQHIRYTSYLWQWRKTKDILLYWQISSTHMPCFSNIQWITSGGFGDGDWLTTVNQSKSWLVFFKEITADDKESTPNLWPQDPESQFSTFAKVWSHQVQFISSTSNPGHEL